MSRISALAWVVQLKMDAEAKWANNKTLPPGKWEGL
jgi:hypothetical protein